MKTEKIKFMSKNKGNIMCQMLLSLRLGNILCMSHSYAVRTEKIKFISKNKGNITCQMLLSLRSGNIIMYVSQLCCED